MQTVILAAGKGTRLRPLTHDTPKSMVPLHGKPLLTYTLEALPEKVDEVVLTVGYLGEQIKEYFGSTYKGRSIRYAHQEKAQGTYDALATAKPLLKPDQPFLCLMGDDLYKKKDLTKLTPHERAILVVMKDNLPERFLACTANERNEFTDIVPVSETSAPYGIYTGACVLTHKIFEEEIVYGPNNEQLLPFMIVSLGQKFPVRMVTASFWFPIAYPEDVEKAEEALRANG